MNYYSQANEDKIMIERYLSRYHQETPVYFEAGAMDGVKYSNTKCLEDSLGWTGILVEPHPENFKALQTNRPNNKLFNTLISNSQKPLEYSYFENINLSAVSGVTETLTRGLVNNFYESDNEWMKKERLDRLHTKKLKPKSLTQIFQESGFDKIDFLSLDVEGHENIVLESFDWNTPITFILIEANNTLETKNLLSTKGYTFVEDIAHNLLFVNNTFKAEHASLFDTHYNPSL